MAFPKNIVERALVACGRSCCLCHNFCGPKIELHHIVQTAKGGEDSFDNCIPLCLDCHAEVKSYNPKHPKGRAYSESELKAHRDIWYKKVANSGGSTASDQYISMDRRMYEQIKNIIPPRGTIQIIKSHHFGDSFNREILKEMENFLDCRENPDFEFMDSDLESLKSSLGNAILDFDNYLRQNTWTLEGELDCSQVPEEWAIENPKRHEETIARIHSLANNVWKCYYDLIRICRRKLGVY